MDDHKGCGGCGACLPPDDGMKRKKEKEQRLTDWVCSFCGEGKKPSNRIFNFDQESGDGYCVCSDCINIHFDYLKTKVLEAARREQHCSFCLKGKVRDNVNVYLFQSLEHNELYKCEVCINEQKQKSECGKEERNKRLLKKVSTPQEIYAILNDYVVGQEQAKQAIAVEVYLRELLEVINKVKPECEDNLERGNILLIGPTGCGKTLIMETLRKKLGKIVVSADANSFSEAGYVGDDIQNIFTLALLQAGGDIAKAQNGIVFIDEIDKIAARQRDKSDVSRGAVQQALLTPLQGALITISPSFERQSETKKIQFDTSQMLFIVAGAFSELVEIIREKESQGKVGFFAISKKAEYTAEEILKMISRDDLMNFGFYPEFLGRFHRIVFMESLTIDHYLKILKEPKNSLVWHWRKVFAIKNKILTIADEALEKIAEKAKKTESGARALRGLFQELMHNTIFTMENDPDDVIGYRVTNESVETGILEKIYKKTCTGNCGENCCQISGGECCGGAGHDHQKETKIVISK